MREILRIDDRGRLVVPKTAREYLGIEKLLDRLDKGTDSIKIVAIISPGGRSLRLTSVSSEDDSMTRTIVEAAMKEGDDVTPLEINKSGRIHTSREIRQNLQLTPDSYLIAVPFGRQDGVKELQIIPLLDSNEALIVRIIRKRGVEWRIVTPIPDDPESLRKKLAKRDVQRIDFFL